MNLPCSLVELGFLASEYRMYLPCSFIECGLSLMKIATASGDKMKAKHSCRVFGVWYAPITGETGNGCLG